MPSFTIPAPTLIITASDDRLTKTILRKVQELGLAFADEFTSQMRLLVRDVLNITPPNSQKARGKAGYAAGVSAINRDLFDMGFEPVEIKGHRTITHVPAGNVKGRAAVAIAPVTVATKLNPKFADPSAFHDYRLQRKAVMGRRRVSRGGGKKGTFGGAQAFYVDITKYTAMKERLYAEIGKLAAGWIGIARALKVPIARWIGRHAGTMRGVFTMNLDPAQGRFFIRAINSLPATCPPNLIDDMERRIDAAKGYRINAIVRGLEGRAKRILQAA